MKDSAKAQFGLDLKAVFFSLTDVFISLTNYFPWLQKSLKHFRTFEIYGLSVS